MSGDVTVLSGPTAVGKGTVVSLLKERFPDVWVSISTTTREPRAGEVDGVHYHFVSRDTFRRMIEQGELLEWAVVHGRDYYGTPSAPVLAAVKEGKRVILEIDLQGARHVREQLPDARFVFLAPPDWDTLISRLTGRGTENAQQRERRLATARVEMAAASEFDHIVVNAELGDTVAELVALLGLYDNEGSF